jgi:hypothetical protein
MGNAVPQFRGTGVRYSAAGIVLGLLVVGLLACSSGTDYYKRDPYDLKNSLDRGLARAEQQLVGWITSGDSRRVLEKRTAAPWKMRMRSFLHVYAGRSVQVLGTSRGDNSTADQRLVFSCAGGRTQPIVITWAWFDGAWRAWPDYTSAGNAAFPGCGRH